MNSNRSLVFVVGCLIVVAGVLVYLEWWRAGELELLVSRVDELELARRRKSRAANANAAGVTG